MYNILERLERLENKAPSAEFQDLKYRGTTYPLVKTHFDDSTSGRKD